MKKLIYIIVLTCLVLSCKTSKTTLPIVNDEESSAEFILDKRDNNRYQTIVIGERQWFKENLRYKSPKSKCFKNKRANCDQVGRLYPSSELDLLCPEGWRVPTIADWNELKHQNEADSITALLDTISWYNPIGHTNQSGLSLRASGHQMGKRLFLGKETAVSIWLNQINKFDEYYHVHLYGGKGISFPLSGYHTNEVFHAHPIEDLENRRLSVRCICEADKQIVN